MGNTEDNKDVELKKIPRNPNIPVKDEEVAALLKKAAEQVADTKTAEVKKSDAKKVEEKNSDAKKSVEKKVDVKKTEEKDTSKRENIDLKKKEEKRPDTKKEYTKKENQKIPIQEEKKMKSEIASEKQTINPDGKSKNVKKADAKNNDFKVEDDVYVMKKPTKKNTTSAQSYEMSVGDVIGSVFEGIWTGIKLIVLVTIVTAVVGFLMSRDLMIRGRSGEQLSKQNMNVAANTLSTRLEERKAGKAWNETVKKEKLTMETDDGKILVAQKIVIDKKSDNWVVILHGQNGTVEDIYDIAFRYATEGYNILMPDLRAHGESEGSLYGMGWLDRLDIINWIDVILDDKPSANVIIHGVDLGASTALMLSGEPLKDSIKCIVAEGAYTNAWEVAKKEYKARHEKWPVFPILHMMNPVMKVWAGYSLKEANTVKQVQKTDVPILLIHGKNDTYVTEDMTKELDQAIASEHEVLTIATGTHEDCRFAEPDTYYNKVFEFAGRYMK